MTDVQFASAVIFALALIHTFSTKFFERLAHTRPAHAGLWHLLGEVEVVFGFWALVLVLTMFAAAAGPDADHRRLPRLAAISPSRCSSFAIMVVAGTRAVLAGLGWRWCNAAARGCCRCKGPPASPSTWLLMSLRAACSAPSSPSRRP